MYRYELIELDDEGATTKVELREANAPVIDEHGWLRFTPQPKGGASHPVRIAIKARGAWTAEGQCSEYRVPLAHVRRLVEWLPVVEEPIAPDGGMDLNAIPDETPHRKEGAP